MKKNVLIVTIILVIAIMAAVLLFLRGDEDTWICQGDEWIKHGNPSSAKPDTGCGSKSEVKAEDDNVGTVNIANPASTNCINKGGELIIKMDASGGQAGICKSPTGQECDEWALLRGECSW